MAEDYSTVIGMALDNNSLPALFFHMDDVSGRVGVFFGGWGFLPSPLGWVRTRGRCLLVLILSMNLEQKRMVLVASGVRDRRQKIEVGVGFWLSDDWHLHVPMDANLVQKTGPASASLPPRRCEA